MGQWSRGRGIIIEGRGSGVVGGTEGAKGWSAGKLGEGSLTMQR